MALQLLRFVGVAGVHLLQVHHVPLDVEPDPSSPLLGGLVLPSLVSDPTALDAAQLTLQPVVSSASSCRAYGSGSLKRRPSGCGW